MPTPVTLADVRQHLELADDDTKNDALIERMIIAARRSAEAVTGISLADDADPVASDDDVAVIGQAMLLTIGHWYANREAVTTDAKTTPVDMPRSAGWLLGSIRKRTL